MSETRIRITAGITRNLGNFESVRYDVSIEDYVREGETPHDATLRIRRQTEKELQDAVNELEAEIVQTRKANKHRGG
jgi:hypothetical protein